LNTHLPEAFQPHVGLSSVGSGDETGAALLPQDSRLQPIDAAVEAHLRAMLQAETFDSLILDAVRPMAFDRQVTAPARFHSLREAVIARLAALEVRATDPGEAAELRAAVDLLGRRSREHELGEALRYALLKG
jgi:BMFP domain-containing protein YqiC